ncbi:MAG TPA: prepilin peptidase, partial [Anaeromyxobacteraceae bacterium]
MDDPGLAILRPLAAAWAACLGAVVGSFLNVVVARLPRGESVVSPRSRCPRCGAAIAWYDNVPLLSWVLLRARCRACRAGISWRYPLVEALAAG